MRTNFTHTVQDEYMTPLYAVNIITPHLKKFQTIWCPFDTEDSNYVKELRRQGHVVFATHIDNDEDFLTYVPKFKYDAIVSNPPFSLKNEILQKCISLDKPFALLLPFTMFNSVRSINTIADSNIQFIVMDKRISFDGNRPNFSCWYVCSGVLPKDVMFHTFAKDPKSLYREEQS